MFLPRPRSCLSGLPHILTASVSRSFQPMPITGEKGKIYDIDWRRAEDLITQAKENLGIEVQKAENIEELCACDILCTATPSSTPLIFGASVRQGTHINAIGSNAPNRQEIDSSVLIKSKVYVDRLEQALEE